MSANVEDVAEIQAAMAIAVAQATVKNNLTERERIVFELGFLEGTRTGQDRAYGKALAIMERMAK